MQWVNNKLTLVRPIGVALGKSNNGFAKQNYKTKLDEVANVADYCMTEYSWSFVILLENLKEKNYKRWIYTKLPLKRKIFHLLIA